MLMTIESSCSVLALSKVGRASTASTARKRVMSQQDKVVPADYLSRGNDCACEIRTSHILNKCFIIARQYGPISFPLMLEFAYSPW